MRNLNHTSVDILKIDIEGFEWELLRNTDWNSIRAGQILLELHPMKGSKVRNAFEMNEIFSRLEDADYYHVSLEPVTMSSYDQVEVAFLHKDWTPSQGFGTEQV